MRRAVDRLKDSLATLLVHDFKNPISAITTNLEFVRSLVEESVPAREAIDDGLLASAQLHTMVLNLLDIARLETGTFPIKRVDTDVTQLVAELVRACGALARASGIEVVADARGAAPASMDDGAVRRALANLVENAIRHAPEGSRVVVSAERDAEALVLRVADHGPGVPAELRDAIFERFSPGVSHARSASNRGLGLTFVRMVARAHGGEISVSDTVPRGATFTLRLPIAQR